MAAGGPGDHPLTDIVKFNLDVYNKTCDSLVREISKFISLYDLSEMFDWFDISPDSKSKLEDFEAQLKVKLQELKKKANNDGWEL